MAGAAPMIADLRAESDDLDALVSDLDPTRWATDTPAAGWTIAHQIAHLLWTDLVALAAVTDEAGFAEILEQAAQNPTGFVDLGAEEFAVLPPARLLAAWRAARAQLHDALLKVAEHRKLAWFGPPMSAASMATARLMETWAHGLDVADSLGVTRAPSMRLRSIAHLGVRTRDFAYSVNGLAPPSEPFHVKLSAPDESVWTWGPQDAAQQVSGPAEDFCMLVTQRRPRSELEVVAVGPDAEQWLNIAQAFAGPPGSGRG